MGILYKGFDPAIERTVAIKLRHLHQLMETMSAEVRARFRRNVRTGQRLSHLDIVAVHFHWASRARWHQASGACRGHRYR
ncbi:hypothetical protein [Piscinibacter sp.]|jgi:serine/threonine-protein kinase|uniref:hypothetical protein n=1 Tax=Piscinibacter sp. TaxID=1903157 RepID=UPI002F3EF542